MYLVISDTLWNVETPYKCPEPWSGTVIHTEEVLFRDSASGEVGKYLIINEVVTVDVIHHI